MTDARRDEEEMHDLSTLVVGTMCHCDDPDECFDHWEFFTHPTRFDEETGHLSSGAKLSEAEMRQIVVLVRAAAGVSVLSQDAEAAQND